MQVHSASWSATQRVAPENGRELKKKKKKILMWQGRGLQGSEGRLEVAGTTSLAADSPAYRGPESCRQQTTTRIPTSDTAYIKW